MNKKPEGEQNPFLPNSGSDSGRSWVKNFFRPKSVVLIVALGAIFVILAFNGGAGGGVKLSGGSVAIGSGSISKTYMFFTDADGDGYTSSTQVLTNSSATWSQHVRLKDVNGKGTGTSYQIPATASLDCYDASNVVYPGSTHYGLGQFGGLGGWGGKPRGDYNCNGTAQTHNFHNSASDLNGANVDDGANANYVNAACSVLARLPCGGAYQNVSPAGNGTYVATIKDISCTNTVQVPNCLYQNCQ